MGRKSGITSKNSEKKTLRLKCLLLDSKPEPSKQEVNPLPTKLRRVGGCLFMVRPLLVQEQLSGSFSVILA